jgi:fumarate reductase subunit D
MEQFAERQKANSGLSTTSLVLGIISIVISIIPVVNYLIYLLAPIGLICGIIAIIQSQSLTKSIIGIILCLVSVVAPIVLGGFIIEYLFEILDLL